MTTALEGDEGLGSHPGRSLPPGKTRYPFYRRLSGPQGRSGQVRKISGFGPRTVQPVASRYTDYATRGTEVLGQNPVPESLCLGLNPRLRGQSPATNRLSHGADGSGEH